MDKITTIQQELNKHIKNSDDSNIEKLALELKNELSVKYKSNIALAQINPIAGDIKSNSIKVMQYIKIAQTTGVDLIVFPELTLMGYPIHDAIDRHPIVVDENVKWLNEIARLTKKTHAAVGFVEPRIGKKFGKKYYNSVAILGEGKIKAVIRKCLLPTYSEFSDYRYFEPSPIAGAQPPEFLGKFGKSKIKDFNPLVEINGNKYAFVICEDGWADAKFFSQTLTPLYDFDPVKELVEFKPDVIVNCSASPSRAKKEQLKHNMLSFVAKRHQIPMVYTNQVGAIDDISFDGASRVYNEKGELTFRATSFEEQFFVINTKEKGFICPLSKGLEKTLTQHKVFSLNYEPDLERTYKTIVQGIRDYFKKCGLKRAVLGLSGGLDSTVSAVLLADALGAQNVYGISMPSKLTSKESKDDAEILAKNLGINFATAPIKTLVDDMISELNPLFDNVSKDWGECRLAQTYVSDNVQARSRATLLWGVANEFCATIPIATSDKSELYMGYATINGDMSGGFAPIADVPKTKLFALARWMNKNRETKEAIPESIILKPPGAELAIDPNTGETLKAEDALMPYEFMDEVIWRLENKHESYHDMMQDTFLYERRNKISREQKMQWLDKFYRRMSTALYKWSILPPSVIVEGRSINKSDYRQPITSSRINYKGHSVEEIEKILKK